MLLKRILLALTTTAVATSAAWAGPHCKAYPESERIPVIKFQEQLVQQGYKITQFEIDDNCYEIEGTNPQGQRIEAYFDMKAGELIKSELDD